MNIPHQSHSGSTEYYPLFLKLTNISDREKFEELRKNNPQLQIHNEIKAQLTELIKLRNPSLKLSSAELEKEISDYLIEDSFDKYGVWVYYSWSNKMVHILGETEFIEVRTNRNKYKIRNEEQEILLKKKIGIIGLSVGQSVALTLAMERICGEIRIADFDSIDLSNLNRLRTGIHNIGLPKVIIAAREIAEIDPYISVKCYAEGINENNINSFINENGKLDLLIDECDNLQTKIICRLVSRQYRIPVIMETSDKGMVDVERFDLEPDRKILHGLIDENINVPELSIQERMQVMMQIVSFENISDRLNFSMTEIGKTISTWPQLASSVIMGGGVVTDTSRRILLNQFTKSGRFYVDLEKIIS